MREIESIRLESEGGYLGDAREGYFYPAAIRLSKEELWAILKLMEKQAPEPLPRDRDC